MLCFISWPESSVTALLIAVLLATAVVGIRISRITHVPRVVGYLVLGIVCRFICQWGAGSKELLDLHLGPAMPTAELIKTLALCLILFAIGSTFDGPHLKTIGRHIWKFAAAEIVVVAVAVFATIALIWVVTRSGHPAQAVFLGIAAVATAPAATLHVLRQYEAKGALTDHIILLTGLNNLASIVLFYIAFLVFAEINVIHAEHMDYGLAWGIVVATVGSAVVGFVLGLLLSLLHIILTPFETLLLFFSTMFAVSVGAKPFGMNYLILCLFMGVAFTNFSIQPQQLRERIATFSDPIYALFFVLAGFKLQLGELGYIGAVGVAYIAMRTVGKIAGGALGVWWLGAASRVSPSIGTGMLCQAGVAIGLGKFLVEHWGQTVDGVFQPDPAAQNVNTVILASVAVFELIGPLATKRAVVRAGEIKAVSLIARRSHAVTQASTVFSRLRQSLRPSQATRTNKQTQALTARHVMRTNIDTLADTANMADVLRFVERSRLNHFFVIDNEGHLVGTIDFKDLRNLVYNSALAQFLSAYDMANTAPVVAMADQPLRELLDVFHEHDVGSLPILENDESRRLLGVVEQRDVLRALHISESNYHDGEEAD